MIPWHLFAGYTVLHEDCSPHALFDEATGMHYRNPAVQTGISGVF
jgi:hypothetical protein